MSDLKSLVRFALEKQPTNFKESFDEILSDRVLNTLAEAKELIAANLFSEGDEDEDMDLDDSDVDEDDDEFDIDDLDIEDIDIEDLEDLDLEDEDEEFESEDEED